MALGAVARTAPDRYAHEYIIANVIVIPMSGWLSAYFGRKRYFAGSIMLFVIASFFCGAASSLLGLIFWMPATPSLPALSYSSSPCFSYRA